MAGQVIPIGFRALDASGTPYSGARLYTFDAAATTTPKATYTTQALSVSHGSYVQGDSAGYFPQAFAAEGVGFYLELRTAAGVVIKTYANVLALGAESTGAIARDFGVQGRLKILGAGGFVRFEAGPPEGDDVGGAMQLAGRDGTALDNLSILANAVALSAPTAWRTTLAVEEALRVQTALTASAAPGVALVAGYNRQKLVINDFLPNTDATNVSMQVSYNNGAAWMTSANYVYASTLMTVGGGSPTGTGSNLATSMPLITSISNAAGYWASGHIELIKGLYNNVHFEAAMTYRHSGGNFVRHTTGGFLLGGFGMPTNLRLLLSAGTASCTISVEPKRGF